jgi:hypothetical protein
VWPDPRDESSVIYRDRIYTQSIVYKGGFPMLKLIRDCAPWLNWKLGAVFAGVLLVGLFAFRMEAGELALFGATPLLGILVCLIPCAIPLLLLRGKGRNSTTPADSGVVQSSASCGCGKESCGIGATATSCQPVEGPAASPQS